MAEIITAIQSGAVVPGELEKNPPTVEIEPVENLTEMIVDEDTLLAQPTCRSHLALTTDLAFCSTRRGLFNTLYELMNAPTDKCNIFGDHAMPDIR